MPAEFPEDELPPAAPTSFVSLVDTLPANLERLADTAKAYARAGKAHYTAWCWRDKDRFSPCGQVISRFRPAQGTLGNYALWRYSIRHTLSNALIY